MGSTSIWSLRLFQRAIGTGGQMGAEEQVGQAAQFLGRGLWVALA